LYCDLNPEAPECRIYEDWYEWKFIS
jgi:hypothetical protein